jgi:hypothetical protein
MKFYESFQNELKTKTKSGGGISLALGLESLEWYVKDQGCQHFSNYPCYVGIPAKDELVHRSSGGCTHYRKMPFE